MGNNMDALARLKGQVNNFKKKDEVEVITKKDSLVAVTQNNLSEYYDLNFVEDKSINEFLINKTLELHTIQANASVELGKVLYEAHKELSGANQYDGLYIKWLDKIGFNKMTALRHRKRYELVCWSHSVTTKNFVATLPVRTIEKLYSHSEREHLVSLIEEGDVSTNTQLMELLEVKNILPSQEKHFNLKLDDIKSEYNEVRTGIVGIDLEKIKDEELENFYRDIEKVKKILQKWNS